MGAVCRHGKQYEYRIALFLQQEEKVLVRRGSAVKNDCL